MGKIQQGGGNWIVVFLASIIALRAVRRGSCNNSTSYILCFCVRRNGKWWQLPSKPQADSCLTLHFHHPRLSHCKCVLYFPNVFCCLSTPALPHSLRFKPCDQILLLNGARLFFSWATCTHPFLWEDVLGSSECHQGPVISSNRNLYSGPTCHHELIKHLVTAHSLSISNDTPSRDNHVCLCHYCILLFQNTEIA